MHVLNIMMGKGIGGLERAGITCHEILTRSGCDVVSVVHSRSGLKGEYTRAGTILTSSSLGAWDAFAAFNLRLKLHACAFDVIVAHGNRALSLAHRLRLGPPVIAVCHTSNYSILKRLNMIDGAIVLTDHYHQVLINAGYPSGRIRLVPNAVHLHAAPQAPPDRKTPIIGALARLVPIKGIDVLLSACASLKTRGIPFRCVIHGADESGGVAAYESMRDQLGLDSEQVMFPGFTSKPKNFLRSIDLFCLPSRKEVLSLSLLEALAAGRPVVCSRTPNLASVFKHGVEGYFVEPENVEQLADTLQILLQDRPLRLNMGKAARARAADFSVDMIGKKMLTALADLSAKPIEHQDSTAHASI